MILSARSRSSSMCVLSSNEKWGRQAAANNLVAISLEDVGPAHCASRRRLIFEKWSRCSNYILQLIANCYCQHDVRCLCLVNVVDIMRCQLTTIELNQIEIRRTFHIVESIHSLHLDYDLCVPPSISSRGSLSPSNRSTFKCWLSPLLGKQHFRPPLVWSFCNLNFKICSDASLFLVSNSFGICILLISNFLFVPIFELVIGTSMLFYYYSMHINS